MKLIVINLQQAEARRAHMRDVMGAQSLKFDWFDAVDGKTIGQNLAMSAQEYQFSEHLLSGEVGCFLSHIACWESFLALGIRYAVIFEDDIVLGENAAHFLSHTSWLPDEFDLIKIDTQLRPCHIDGGSSMELDGNRKLHPLLDNHSCTGGYVISARGARRLLDSVKASLIEVPVDDYIYSAQESIPYRAALRTFQMVPAICIQVGTLKRDPMILPSFITGACKPFKLRQTIAQKLRRETWRIILKSFKVLKDRIHDIDRVIIPFR